MQRRLCHHTSEGHRHLHSSNHTNSQDKPHTNTINMYAGVDVAKEGVGVAMEAEDVDTTHIEHHQRRPWVCHTRKEPFLPHQRNIANQ